jgi:pimeloyl-ACP methyl ester carboxylesterase
MGQGFRKGEEMKNWILCIIALAFIVTGSVGSAAENSSDAQYLIYLHGWIIQEQQDPRPQHPQFGYYEYEEILKTFRDQGFIVSSEIRPKTATIESAADLLVLQIQELLKSGVPANRVTVVGGSMGAGIALVASARLENANVRFAVLGTCLSASIDWLLANDDKVPCGQILSIREASDQYTSTCAVYEEDLKAHPSLHAREIILNTELDHGFLFKPLPEWVQPVLEWVAAGK